MEARRIAGSPSLPAGAGLTRRSSLLLPLLLAACGGGPRYYPPLRFTQFPPIRLNVAHIEIEQHFIPSGMPPDVTQFDPEPPSDALRAMANDRLKAFGTAGYAAFVIQDASLIKQGDTITGNMDVVLNVYPSPNAPRAGFAEARVSRQYTGDIDDLRARLYDMTRAMMQAMNVEFEYQVQNRLHDWVVSGNAAVPRVQQQPLNAAPLEPPPSAPTQLAPPAQQMAPPAPQLNAPPPQMAPPASLAVPPPPVPMPPPSR